MGVNTRMHNGVTSGHGILSYELRREAIRHLLWVNMK